MLFGWRIVESTSCFQRQPSSTFISLPKPFSHLSALNVIRMKFTKSNLLIRFLSIYVCPCQDWWLTTLWQLKSFEWKAKRGESKKYTKAIKILKLLCQKMADGKKKSLHLFSGRSRLCWNCCVNSIEVKCVKKDWSVTKFQKGPMRSLTSLLGLHQNWGPFHQLWNPISWEYSEKRRVEEAWRKEIATRHLPL